MHQPIVVGVRGFRCASNYRKLVAGDGTLTVVIESVVRGVFEVLYVMDWPSREACEEREFRDAEGVEVSGTGQGFIHDSVHVSVLYLAVGTVYAVIRRAMIRHLVGAFEQDRLGCGGTGYAHLLDDQLVLPPPQEIKFNHDLSTCASHVRLRMTGFLKITYLLYELRQH